MGDKNDWDEDDNPWAPPGTAAEPVPSGWGKQFWLALIGGITIGIILGLVDIHQAGLIPLTVLAYFGIGIALGVWLGNWTWASWPQQTICLYLIHLVAIDQGYRPPFVEKSAEQAIMSLVLLLPSGFGIGIGVFYRWAGKSSVKLDS